MYKIAFFSCVSRKGFGKYLLTKGTQLATKSRFEHVGVIFQEDGEEYLFETTTKETRKIRFEDKVKEMISENYKGDIITITIPENKYNKDAFFDDINNWSYIKSNYSYIHAFFTSFAGFINLPLLVKKSTTFCSSTVVMNAVCSEVEGVLPIIQEKLITEGVAEEGYKLTSGDELVKNPYAINTDPQECFELLEEAGYKQDDKSFLSLV